MQGITFRKGIKILLESKKHIFNIENDELFSNPKEMNTYGILEDNLVKSIESHIKQVCEIQTIFNLYFEPEEKGILD